MKKIYKLFALAVLLCCSISLWAAQSLPYSYGFENDQLELEDGWTKYFGTSLSKNNNECAIVGDAKKTGSYGFRFSSYQTSGANAQYLISPELDASAGVDLTFWYKASYGGGVEKFKVGYSTTDADVANFTWGEENSTNSTSWLKFEGSFPAGTKYVAIYYYSNYQYRLYVDDFEFVAKASGPALQVFDGSEKISSGHNYNFGLATAGTLKMFIMKNPGTESAPIKVTHTGDFTVTPSTQISIPAGEGSVLAIYMPETSGSDVITISSTAESIDDFIINVSGTVRDESKVFETLLDGAIPEDWSTSGGTWSWSTTNGASNTAWYETSNYRLITPQLTVAEGEQFFVEVQGTYAGYQGFKFEYSADGSTWTSSATVPTITSDWQTLSFNDVPAGKYYIALHGWHVNIRNFYGGSVPSVPKNITLDSKTANSLMLSWTAAGSETAWKLQYSTDGTNWSDEVAVATNPFELTGLSANTLYYVRVRADIASSEWSKVASFRTECGAIEALPYAENFEGHDVDAAPVCWELLNAQSASTSTYPYIAVKAQSGYYKDAKALFFRSNDNTGYAISPEFSFSLAKAQIAFSHKEESSTGTIVLGYLTDIADASTFVALYNCTSSSSWTDEDGISLASVPEGARLAFQHTGKSYYYDAAVDNITISLAPSCVKPSGLTISEETAQTAKVAWTSEATQWDLEYKLSSASEWTAAASVTNPFVLEGLEANAAYDVRVRNNCGESQSDWVEASFNTLCEAKTLPFAEDFESNKFADCWSADSRWATNSNAHASSYSARYTSGAKADLVLPSITLSDDAMLFYWHASSYPTGAILVNGTQVQTIATTKDGDWKKDSLDLSAYKGQTIVITFESNYTTYSNRYLYIDDILVDYKPVILPTNVQAVPGNASATITWESTEGTSWNLRYRIVKAEEPYNEWTTLEGLTAKSKELTGLTNGTEYEVQVQTIASANRQSDWTASVTFVPQSCATVETVTFGARTFNSIVVNWTATGAGAWDIRYKAAGDADWTSAGTGLAEATKTLTGLTTGVAYTVEVKAACGEAWVAGEAFTLAYSIPANVAVASITDVAASASWDAIADADSYQYIVLASGEPNWESATAAAENSASLTGLSAGTAYTLYVRSVYSTGYSEAASANFSTITIAPQNLQQDGESLTTSATFTWEANGAATQYQWSIDNTNWSEPIAALTATATGLKSGSSYTFYVRSYYNADVQSAAISLPFQTECAVETLPFSQDFGTTSAAKPACWNIANWASTGGNTWYAATDYAKTGYALRYNARTNNSSDAITPSITLSDDAQLSFYVKNSAGKSAYITCQVFINDGESDTEITEALGVNSRCDAATLKTCDLSAFKGKTITIRFHGVGYDTGSNYYLWIDDVTVTFKPVATPTNLAAVSANQGATITWESEEGTSWNLRYRVVDTEEWTNVEGLTAKSKELTGLTNGTTYEVQVQTVVSANRKSDWTASATFTPQACATVETVTFGARTYNSIVVNWTTSGAGTWNLDFKQGDLEWVERHNLTEQTLTLEDLATGIEYTVVVYPTCNAEGAVENTFTLGYTAPVAAEAENITDAAATVQWLAVADASSYEYDFVLPGDEADWKGTSELSATASNLVAGTDYLFVVRSVYPTGHSEADTTEFKTITIAPTALVKEAATTESITFSWSYAGAATQFQYKVNDGEWSAAQTALTATAEGLSAGTTYIIYVRAYYADGKYSAELSGDLSTECGTYALPYEQNFEAEGLPLCWETENWGTDANQWGRSSEYKKTGYYSIRYNANTDSYAEISLPTIHLDDIAVLTFYTRNSYYANYSYNYVSGKVIVSAAGEEPQEVAINNNSAYSLAEQTIELDSKFVDKDVTITFHAEGVGASAYLYIDDVTVIAKPCPTTSLSAAAALDSVVLTWSGDATQYQYCIEEGEAEPSAWTLLDEDVFTVTVKGLTPNQAYTAYVRSYCSASKQGEAAKQAFTPVCPAPTALVVDEVSTTTATLSWTAAAGISKYQYRLGTDEWSNENVVEGTSVELTSLSPATTYTLYVRSWYNADVQSTTAITKSFTTECAAVELPFNETFDGDITCWTLENCNSYTGVSDKAFRFYFNSNPPQYLISPELVPTEQNVKVQFEYKGQSTSYKEEFQLGYSLTTKEITAFAWSDTVFCQETDYQDYVQVLPAGVRYIAIRYTANNQYYLYIDNFSAEETTDYPTALDNTGAEGEKATKRLENDVLIIEFNGVQYNAQGQLLKK